MKREVLAASALSAVLLAPEVRAQDTSDLEGMLDQAVVTTASETAEAASTAPATTSTITAEDLRRFGIRSLDQAINFLSLGMVTENPLSAVDVGARGVMISKDYGDHVLLLVNGHAVNEQWNGSAYFDRGAGVPFELIDHIEVILGPGSVLYGSNAMLGVINIVTKRAKDFAGAHAIVESELPTSIRGAVGLGKEWKLFGQKGEITAAVEYFGSKGPGFTFDAQNVGADGVTGTPKRFSFDGPGTGVWGGQRTVNTPFVQVPSAYVRVMLGNLEVNARASLYKRWSPIGFGNFDDPTGFELDRWVSLDAKYRVTLSSKADLRVRLYGDTYDYQEFDPIAAPGDCVGGQLNGCNYRLLGISRWGGAEVQSHIDWLADGRLSTLLGVDGRVREFGSKTDYLDAATNQSPGSFGAYDHVEKALGAYLEQTMRPTRWLGLNAGARFDYVQRFAGHLSPRVAATVSPWHGGTLKVVYSEAFRAPSGYESFYVDPNSQLIAKDLRPETVRSVEGSFEQRIGTHRVLVGVFRSWWKDLVASVPLTDAELAAAIASGELAAAAPYASQYRNLAAIENYGVNLAFDGTELERKVFYGLGVTAAYARQDPGDGTSLPLPLNAQMFGNARIGYDLGGKLPVIALVGRVTGRRPTDLGANSGFTPMPYAKPLAELRATISGPVPGLGGLSYRVSANYAFASNGAYVAGPNSAQPTPGGPGQPALVPVDRFRTAIGLQYDLPL